MNWQMTGLDWIGKHKTGIITMTKIQYCPTCRNALVEKEFEGKCRLACPSESCDYVYWDSPIPVVAGIVEYDGKIILARNRSWPGNMFGLVTGFLEKDEFPEAGIVREVQEELGLTGKVVSLVGLYPFAMMNQLIIAYHVTGAGEILLGPELAEIKLVEPGRLKPWNFGTGLAVRDWVLSLGNAT